MPATRRTSSGSARGKGQSTLSFNHRVTKSSANQSAKDLSSTPAKQSPLAKQVARAEIESDVDDTVKVEEAPSSEASPAAEQEEEPAEKTVEELRAEKISSRQINQYWRKIENERMTKRVHQQDLSQSEKILRYWDVSSQYGPCVGITRMKRWQRADKLGLHPPVEVLAVLLQEESRGTEKAHMDDILNSTAVGAG